MRYDFGNQIVKGQKHLYKRGKRMTKKRNVVEGDNFDQVKTKKRQQKKEKKDNPPGGRGARPIPWPSRDRKKNGDRHLTCFFDRLSHLYPSRFTFAPPPGQFEIQWLLS